MLAPDTNTEVVALQALGWTIADPERARRLIDITGLDPADLRGRADEPAVLAAVLAFLEANERDLTACAEEIGVAPETLVRARARLEGGV